MYSEGFQDYLDEARSLTIRKKISFKNGLYDYVIDSLCDKMNRELNDKELEVVYDLVYNNIVDADEIINNIIDNSK